MKRIREWIEVSKDQIVPALWIILVIVAFLVASCLGGPYHRRFVGG